MSTQYQNKKAKRNPDGTWEHFSRSKVTDLREFMGFDKLVKLCIIEPNRTQYYAKENPFMSTVKREKKRAELQFRDSALQCTCFLTGGRISEVLMLHANNFHIEEEQQRIIVNDMPLLKRYTVVREVLGSFKEIPPKEELVKLPSHLEVRFNRKEMQFDLIKKRTTPEIKVRKPFPIPLWEKPLVDVLLDRIQWAQQNQTVNQRHPWLFPSGRNQSSMGGSSGIQKWVSQVFEIESRQWMSPVHAYTRARMLGERVGLSDGQDMWNHRWRSERASFLGECYEFDDNMLDYYFGWEPVSQRTRMSRRYSRTGLRSVWRRMKELKSSVSFLYEPLDRTYGT